MGVSGRRVDGDLAPNRCAARFKQLRLHVRWNNKTIRGPCGLRPADDIAARRKPGHDGIRLLNAGHRGDRRFRADFRAGGIEALRTNIEAVRIIRGGRAPGRDEATAWQRAQGGLNLRASSVHVQQERLTDLGGAGVEDLRTNIVRPARVVSPANDEPARCQSDHRGLALQSRRHSVDGKLGADLVAVRIIKLPANVQLERLP